MSELILNLLFLLFTAAVFIAALSMDFKDAKSSRMQEDILRRGVKVEAEVLARFEAGALVGSELAKAREPLMASWDPLELELRYVYNGREIVSRGRVSVETFFRTRTMKTVKIKVLPDRPELWAASSSL
ncbi:MAG TPA: hypothetical protein VJ725_14945 [Thermoanaerobaculia bacterium]|nr:hypothetical protein [Thermoanaerobaculia bacterium]